jgi:hypothetical protein
MAAQSLEVGRRRSSVVRTVIFTLVVVLVALVLAYLVADSLAAGADAVPSCPPPTGTTLVTPVPPVQAVPCRAAA